MGLADLREPAAAGAAFEETGEQIIRPAGPLGANPLVPGHDSRPRVPLPVLDRAPELVIDNPEVRHLLDDPFNFGVESRLTPSRIWILDKLLAVPDQTANIKLVVENPRTAPLIAVNRGRSPAPTGRTGNSLLVERLGNRSWRAALSELLEDPAHNGRFAFVDATFAVQSFAGSVHLAHHVVTEAETASRLALTNPTFQPAPRLVREVLQE